MKEKSYRFRESFGRAFMTLSDNQAGQLIKALCVYSFNGKEMNCEDSAVNSAFSLLKVMLDADEINRLNGRKGGLASADKIRAKSSILVIANTTEQKCPMEDLLENMLLNKAKGEQSGGSESVAKKEKYEAG